MRLKVVFLDIDNTLLDFDDHVRRTLMEGFEHYHLKSYEETDFALFETVNSPLWKRVEKGEITIDYVRKNRFNLYFEKLGVKMDGVEFEAYFREAIKHHAKLVPESLDLLNALKGKVIIAAASNSPISQQSERLALAGILSYFDDVFVSDALGYAKPNPKFFSLALDKIQKKKGLTIQPEECAIIGDSLSSDIQGGINAKMHTLYFEFHPSINQRIIPEYSSSSLKEIATYLESKNFNL